MTFEEWWESLDTREQNSTNYALTKEAWQAALAAEQEKYKKAFQKMRNVAAGYSNHCEDNGSTRRLEREFTEAEEMFRALGEK